MCDYNTTGGAEELLQCVNHNAVLRAIPVMCFICLLMITGAIGNFLVVLTYYNKLENSSTNFFIFCLAVFDIISTCFGLPMTLYGLTHPYNYGDPILCKIHFFLSFSSDVASGFIIVFISFDRYMRIARPHRGMNRSKSRSLVIFAVLFSMCLCSFSLFVYGSKETVFSRDPLVVGHSCSVADVARETAFPLIFSATILLCFFVGTCILSVVYIKLGLHVRRWNEQRRYSSQVRPSRLQSSEDSSSTKGDSSEKSDLKSKDTGDFVKKHTMPLNVVLLKTSKTDDNLNSMSLDRKFRHSGKDTSLGGYRTLPISKSSRIVKPKTDLSRRKSSLPSISSIKKSMTLSKTTLMFISATAAFIGCHIPYICVKIVSVVMPGVSKSMTSLEYAFYSLAAYSFVMTYAANPLIYSFMNPRFRSNCCNLLRSVAKRMCYRKSEIFTVTHN